jgi:LacI family transcriptional regulator
VREKTVNKVNQAIAELGYVRDAAAANLARGRMYHFVFLLPASENEFMSALSGEIRALSTRMRHERAHLSVKHVPAFDPMALSRAVDEIDTASVNGVAIFGPETPTVRDSVAHLQEKGLSVVSLVADIPSSNRDHFVGFDNVAAGRTAARLMGRFIGPHSGKILVLTGSMLARDHLERRLGFDEVMGRDYPHLDLMASFEGRDDPELIAKRLPRIFEEHSGIVGIYSSAAGNEGLLHALTTSGTSPKPVIIAHELTPLSRTALQDGRFDAVISQDAGHLIRSAVRVMRAKTEHLPINPAQERIRIDVYLKENMPL